MVRNVESLADRRRDRKQILGEESNDINNSLERLKNDMNMQEKPVDTKGGLLKLEEIIEDVEIEMEEEDNFGNKGRGYIQVPIEPNQNLSQIID